MCDLFLSGILLFGCFLCSLFLFIFPFVLAPIYMMAVTIYIVIRKTEELQSLHQEFDLSLNIEFKFYIVILETKEVVTWLVNLKTCKPAIEL
jgi:capsular polysaccharide biosynthesis protein